ncbi:MAG: ABC transporter permease, partial [Anaerolineae bacterium]|nr:ABC transporter permease [Anaerolineae bacterium]
MLSKIWTIAWKELYTTFTDRNLMLIMIVTPLALATIIGLAFSNFINASSDVPVSDIPMAIVNLDQGSDANGAAVNNGDILVDIFAPEVHRSNDVIDTLTNAEKLDDADAARQGVDTGKYAAAIIIPADFSQKLTYSQTHSIEPVSVEVYASPASPVSASIVRSITEGVVSQIATGNIAVEATIRAIIETNPVAALRLATAGDALQEGFAPAFNPGSNPVTIQQQTVTGEAATFNPLVTFGAAQAVFFMLFTAMGGANSLLEEQRDGTLQRLLVSPTPRTVILLGKLIGTFITCVVQVTILIIALTIVGSIIAGQIDFIWGDNILLVALMILAVALAASGLGSLVASLVRTPEQGNVIGGVISMAMGVFGGAFFGASIFPPSLQWVTR